MREKYISFAQFVYFLREVCFLFNFWMIKFTIMFFGQCFQCIVGPLRTDIVNISTRKCHGKVSESAFSVTTMHRLRKNSAELGFFVIGMLQCMGESFSATFIRIAHWETWPQNLSFLYKDIKSDNLQYNTLGRWVDGSMGRSSHRPSVWCSKYILFFFIISCKILCKNLFNFIFL